jgi:hypothetical protein
MGLGTCLIGFAIIPLIRDIRAKCFLGEQIVRVSYYGRYCNVSRGKWQMKGNNDAVPSTIESQRG